MNVFWYAAAGLCLVVAAVYLLKSPQSRRVANSWQRVVLRWAHGTVWLVLAGSFLVRTTELAGAADLANGLALVAGGLYATFVATFVAESLIGPSR